ncbi:hypothetical protein JZO72_06625 [Vagococcus fluvialis]|uniref:hypothetical protein n=1 Tax=Vagococcus fluvialis TaxID=2738 RepID=UPI001A8F0F64|nr:hypothetical protein [Vagococcus fluvialis]MBO0479299.1 hypothetical protein [Vagococcus fluvialis]MBO0485157.1 hypothetical protein [Vagococcus fluvialis]
MENNYKVSTPVVEELQGIDQNLNDLENAYDELVKVREQELEKKGRYSLEAFQTTKLMKKDIEDMEKVIAEAYAERSRIVEECCNKYLKEVTQEFNSKDSALASEVREQLEEKSFQEVMTFLGSKAQTYLKKQKELSNSFYETLDNLGKLFSFERDRATELKRNISSGFRTSVGWLLNNASNETKNYLDELIRLDGKEIKEFSIK